ncbi:MAG: methionine--tRNA ligase, partial [Bradymonadia bacterium]
VRATYEGARANLIQAMDELAFQRALGAVWDLVHVANKYVDTTAPWVLARDPARKARLREVLYTLCEALRIVGIWSLPFLPEKAALLLDRLGIPADARTLAHTAAWGGLAAGTRTQPGDGLFPRIEKVVEPVVEAPKASAPKAPPPKTVTAPVVTAPATAAPEGLVRFEDFARLTLKTARVLTAERHPNADRLLVLGLDAGEDAPRTVCAGIAQAYAPEALVGQTVVLLANLEPRKIRGIASNGMLLAAGEGETLRLVTVPGDLPPGTSIG